MRLIGTKIYDDLGLSIYLQPLSTSPSLALPLARQIGNYVNIRIGGVVVKRTNANSVWMKVMIMMVIDNLL